MDKLQSAISHLTHATANLREQSVVLIQGNQVEEAQRLLAHVRQIDEQRVACEQSLTRLTKAAATKPA